MSMIQLDAHTTVNLSHIALVSLHGKGLLPSAALPDGECVLDVRTANGHMLWTKVFSTREEAIDVHEKLLRYIGTSTVFRDKAVPVSF